MYRSPVERQHSERQLHYPVTLLYLHLSDEIQAVTALIDLLFLQNNFVDKRFNKVSIQFTVILNRDKLYVF